MFEARGKLADRCAITTSITSPASTALGVVTVITLLSAMAVAELELATNEMAASAGHGSTSSHNNTALAPMRTSSLTRSLTCPSNFSMVDVSIFIVARATHVAASFLDRRRHVAFHVSHPAGRRTLRCI